MPKFIEHLYTLGIGILVGVALEILVVRYVGVPVATSPVPTPAPTATPMPLYVWTSNPEELATLDRHGYRAVGSTSSGLYMRFQGKGYEHR